MRKPLLLLLILLVFSGQAFAAGTTVVVGPETKVPGPLLTVGDLATVSGDNPDLVRAVRELKLGSAPLPGSRLVLSAEEFSARLADAGADFKNVSWQIPPFITITAAGQVVRSCDLQAMAIREIKHRLNVPEDEDSPDVVITPVGKMADKMVPPGVVSLKLELPYGIHMTTPTVANAAISTDGRAAGTVTMRFTVKVWQKVVVANRNMAAGDTVTGENLRTERWDISRLTGYFTDNEKVIGQQVKRDIPAGTPVCAAFLEKPVLVARGSVVTILVQVGDIIVTSNGKALQAGSQDQLIRVQNMSSNKIVSARVVDSSTVQVIIYSGR
jgi:flagellar basal body P-ring formation protein FlgA